MPYRRRPKALALDICITMLIVAVMALLFMRYDVFEIVYELTRVGEYIQADELVGVLLMLLLAETYLGIRYLLYLKSVLSEYEEAKEKIAKLVDINVRREKMIAMTELTGGLAHEINNSLQPVIGLGGFIKEGLKKSGNKKHYVYMENIMNSARHAQKIIENVLVFSQEKSLTMGQGSASAALFDAVRFSVNMMKPSLNFVIKGFPDVEMLENDSVQIEYNQTALYEIVINIIKNAASAMDHKGDIHITFSHAIMPNPPHLSAVCLSIADSGKGMDQETLNKIYDPFFTTKDISEGTGLGLSIVYGLMHQHNGQIVVNSLLGEGSVFMLYFPVKLLT